jgi:iron complex transport system substrate-binding protein
MHRHTTGRLRRAVAVVLACSTTTVLAACASTGTAASTSSSPTANSTAASPSAARTQYPVDITDCGGRVTTYSSAPQRVVAFDPAIVEPMLLLGLKDRIVGLTDFQTPDQRWETTKADMDSLTRINDGVNYPSKEQVVALSPDLVVSIYSSALTTNETLPDRDGWKKLGVNSFLASADCLKAPITDFSPVYDDIRTLGVLFDVQEKAERVIGDLQTRVAQLQAEAASLPTAGRTMMTYSGEDEPFPSGGIGMANAIMELAGVTNTFGDLQAGYDTVSWEQIAKRNPEIIWVMTSAGSGFVEEATGITDKLAKDSRVSGVTAVKDEAYVVVSYNEGGVQSPRNVDALERLIDGLAALG